MTAPTSLDLTLFPFPDTAHIILRHSVRLCEQPGEPIIACQRLCEQACV